MGDEFGRVKVQFDWDREVGPPAESSGVIAATIGEPDGIPSEQLSLSYEELVFGQAAALLLPIINAQHSQTTDEDPLVGFQFTLELEGPISGSSPSVTLVAEATNEHGDILRAAEYCFDNPLLPDVRKAISDFLMPDDIAVSIHDETSTAPALDTGELFI